MSTFAFNAPAAEFLGNGWKARAQVGMGEVWSVAEVGKSRRSAAGGRAPSPARGQPAASWV